MTWEGTGRGGRPWRRKREAVMRRDSYLCQHCRDKGRMTTATEVHHIVGLAEGGTDDEGNLISLCNPCHIEAETVKRGGKPRVRFDANGFPVW
jgi:5-methylcytosine-specific restriction protein A